MITIDTLRRFGAKPEEGLKRCLNNEGMYLKLVNMSLQDASFDRLAAAVGAGDKKAAFEAVHSIKGVMANLAITPLYEPCSEMTELLRAGKDADYTVFVEQILQKRRELLAMGGA